MSVEENKIRKTCERYRALVRRVSLECLLFPSRRKEEMEADCSLGSWTQKPNVTFCIY